MPYFQHVNGSSRRLPCKRGGHSGLLPVLSKKLDDFDIPHWRNIGVGAFERGGRRAGCSVRFHRHQELNQRIGQALLRLERRLTANKSVRQEAPQAD
jgi:hypothetical protein